MKRTLVFISILLFSINFILASPYSYNVQDSSSVSDVSVNIFQGNLTNFSQMVDSDTATNPPNDGDGITWSAAIGKWVATVLNGDSIWKKIGKIISPLNASDSLDMSGGNVTASFFFGDGSQMTNLPTAIDNSKEGDGNLLYNDSDTMFFNTTKADENYMRINGSNAADIVNMTGSDLIVDRINLSDIVFIGPASGSGQAKLIVGDTCDFANAQDGSICASGQILSNSSMATFATPNGASFNSRKSVEASPLIKKLGFTGVFDASNNLFCDPTNPFTEEDAFNGLNVISASPSNLNRVVGEISNFVNSSCVVWEPETRVGFNITDVSSAIYFVSDIGMILTLDSGEYISAIEGKNAKYKISFKNTSIDNFLIDFIGSEDNQIVSKIQSDQNGQTGTTNLISRQSSTENVSFTAQSNIIIQNDYSNFIGGQGIGIQFDIPGLGDIGKIIGIKMSSLISTIFQSSRERSLSKSWIQNSTGIFNITNQINDSDVLTTIHQENGSISYYGNTINFTDISFSLSTGAGSSIEPKFYFCNSSEWTQFTVTDGTDGLQHTGNVEFITPESRGICNFNLSGATFPDTNNYTYIAIERNAATITGNIFPIIRTARIFSASSEIIIGNAEGITGADRGFGFINKELQEAGGISFYIGGHDRSGNPVINALWQIGKNESAGFNRNSFSIFSERNLTSSQRTNATFLTVPKEMWNAKGITNLLPYSSSMIGADLAVEHGIETQTVIVHNDLGNGLLRVEGDFNNFMGENDHADFIGGVGLHIETITQVETGFLEGALVILNPPTTDFETGEITPQFVQITTTGGANEWIVGIDPNNDCPNGECARAQGGALSPPRIMESNFSTQPFDNLNLTFNLTTINLDSGDIFNVTINNNTGSGEQEIFSIIDGSNVVNAKINPPIPSNMNNASVVSLRYYLTANVANEEAFVDLIVLTGNATEDTTANVPRGDGEIHMGSDETEGIFFKGGQASGRSNLTLVADDIIFEGNTTFASVTQTTVNITESINVAENITVGDTTITDKIQLNGTNKRILDWRDIGQFIFGSEINNDLGWININEGITAGFNSTFNESYINKLGGNNINGTQDFNGGWTDGGLSIIGGDILVQTLFAINISSLLVTELSVNGSMIPSFDNLFDLGSGAFRWRNLFLAGDATINGTVTANTYFGDGSQLTGVISGMVAFTDQTALNSLLYDHKSSTFQGVLGMPNVSFDRYVNTQGVDVNDSNGTFFLSGSRKIVNDGVGGFNVTLYTGNSPSDNEITGLGFKPDFVWIKSRGTTDIHYIFDVVRGPTKYIDSSGTAAEVTAATTLKSFDADGFTLGAENGVNGNGEADVAWAFEVPDQQVAWAGAGTDPDDEYINENTGMSIIQFSSGGAGDVINHNLGAKPAFMLLKNIDASENWFVYHQSLGDNPGEPGDNPEDYFLVLETTSAANNDAGAWADTAPTATEITFGIDLEPNNYIAYLWKEVPGFSKFGTYEGNNPADNPITGLGFRPEMVLIKGIDTTNNWYIFDDTRDNSDAIEANTVDTEVNRPTYMVSIDDDGFTVGANTETNSDGLTYIYAAFGAKGTPQNISFISEPANASDGGAPDSITTRALFEPVDADQTLNTDLKLFVSRVFNSTAYTFDNTSSWTQATLSKGWDVTSSVDFIKGTASVSSQTDSGAKSEIRYWWVGNNTKTQAFHGTHQSWL